MDGAEPVPGETEVMFVHASRVLLESMRTIDLLTKYSGAELENAIKASI